MTCCSFSDVILTHRSWCLQGGAGTSGATEELREDELFDGECLKLMNEYFYGVRIFPGQDPAHVYIGWVTTQYHIHDTAFDQSKVRSVIVQEYTEEGHIQSA